MGRPQEPRRQPWFSRIWRKPFFLLVILPSLLVAGYLYGIAAPQYVSEARFVVRSRGGGTDIGAQIAGMRGIAGAALGGFGGGAASSEATSIRDFLTSLDAVMQAQVKSNAMLEKAYVVRPHPQGLPDQIMAVDWVAIRDRGDTTSNYQLFPGDRLVIPGGPDPGLVETLFGSR